jgi:exodeoxyribonuclease III
MKIATWNVNSIRARQDRLLAWLGQAQPDVVCLQELKVTDDAFPYAALEAAGYHAAVHGQKTYNGVAILSRTPAADVCRGLGDGADDPQARFLAARIGALQVVSAYVPNGQVVGAPAYDYKLAWLARLRAFLEKQCRPGAPLVVCGDFNVARDDRDVSRPAAWAESVLFHPDARAALEHVLGWGLVDVVRQRHGDELLLSWWDYRMLAFPKNDGLRLDYIFATPPLAGCCTSAEIDRQQRKGEKPSDHAPVIAVFEEQRSG